MESKNYVYYGAELPYAFPVDESITQTAEKENAVWPPLVGRLVGACSDKHGRISYIEKDREAGNTAYFDWLLKAHRTISYNRVVTYEDKATGTCEKEFATAHFLLYKAEDALFDAPTVEEGVDDTRDVETDALIEVALSTVLGNWKRYLYFELKTAGPFPNNLVGFIQNNLEDAIKDMASTPDSGIDYVAEDDNYYVQFFNCIGECEEFSFCTLSELFNNIVGIRFVKMDSRIAVK